MLDDILEYIFFTIITIALLGFIAIAYFDLKTVEPKLGCQVVFYDEDDLYLQCNYDSLLNLGIGDTLEPSFPNY